MTKLIVTPEFDTWLSRVRDRQAATAIAGRLSRARLGNLGHWRAVGDDVSEMKIDVGSTQAADIKRARAIAKELEF